MQIRIHIHIPMSTLLNRTKHRPKSAFSFIKPVPSLVGDTEPGIKCCWTAGTIQRRGTRRSGREPSGRNGSSDMKSEEAKMTRVMKEEGWRRVLMIRGEVSQSGGIGSLKGGAAVGNRQVGGEKWKETERNLYSSLTGHHFASHT